MSSKPATKISVKTFGIALFSVLTFPLIWIPALGWLHDDAITWGIFKFGLVFVLVMTIYYSAQIKYSFAKTDPLIRSTLLLFSGFLYFIRTVELINESIHLEFFSTIVYSCVAAIISIRWSSRYYSAYQKKLEHLRSLGLLRKYGIFDETAEFPVYKQGYLPTTDGRTPEEEAIKEKRMYQWMLLIPASGLAFFFIRTWSGSTVWILLTINICIYIYSLSGGMFNLAYANQMKKWEKQFDKPIYRWTN